MKIRLLKRNKHYKHYLENDYYEQGYLVYTEKLPDGFKIWMFTNGSIFEKGASRVPATANMILERNSALYCIQVGTNPFSFQKESTF